MIPPDAVVRIDWEGPQTYRIKGGESLAVLKAVEVKQIYLSYPDYANHFNVTREVYGNFSRIDVIEGACLFQPLSMSMGVIVIPGNLCPTCGRAYIEPHDVGRKITGTAYRVGDVLEGMRGSLYLVRKAEVSLEHERIYTLSHIKSNILKYQQSGNTKVKVGHYEGSVAGWRRAWREAVAEK